jgi:hypothetical protein
MRPCNWKGNEERTLGNAIASDGRIPLPIVVELTKAFALLQPIHQYHVNTRRTKTVTPNHGAPNGNCDQQRHTKRGHSMWGHDESGRAGLA